jgi:hypothetical protein
MMLYFLSTWEILGEQKYCINWAVDISCIKEADKVVDNISKEARNRSREGRNIGILIVETAKDVKLFLISLFNLMSVFMLNVYLLKYNNFELRKNIIC